MFLLIRLLNAYPITKFCSLNSIMFLLILQYLFLDLLCRFIFKFHYVSINSGLKRTGCCGCPFFKFHYVSINSKLTFSDIEEDNDFKFHYVSINSSVTIQCLQSIHTFKFHYVSINSIMAVKQLNK